MKQIIDREIGEVKREFMAERNSYESSIKILN